MGKVSVTWSACFAACLMLLLLPLRWSFAMAAASAVHEAFHIAAVRLCGYRIGRMDIHFGGAVIKTPPMEKGRELLCVLAGPFGGLLTVPLYRIFPEMAVCALLQTLYNLLPFPNLDGGRALRCILVTVFRKNTLQR